MMMLSIRRDARQVDLVILALMLTVQVHRCAHDRHRLLGCKTLLTAVALSVRELLLHLPLACRLSRS